MANVGTSTVAYATQQPTGSLVFVASDGTACVLWNDGTNQKFSYASPPYSSWTTTTLVTGLNMALGGRFRVGTDNIDVVSGGSANVRGNYFPLTKIGATYSLGTSNVITGTTAIGTTAVGNVMQYAGQDPQGRHWIVVGGASTYTAETGYFSPANSPTSTGWTASPSSAVAQTGDVNLPAGDQIGNYILRIWWNGTALQYSRADNSAASVGAWATAATIPNLTGSPNGSSRVVFRAISSTQALLAYSTGSGIYAQTYNPSTNTFSTATQLSTNASDRHPAIATDNAGNAWVFWCSFAAANSYALVYKKWNGTSWATSATTLIASGTNIANPSASYGSVILGVTYTVGTANPFTVGWATVSIPILNQTRTAPASAALLQTVTGHLPYQTVIKSHSPLAYWRLNEASGGGATDASGNGKTAALSGVTAYSSPGAIARDSDTSLAFTAAGGLTFPLSLNITAMTTLGLEFWIELAGVWEYVGVDYDGTTTTVYRNGAPYTPDASAPVGIDQGFYWAGTGAAGNLDEVAVYSRLTQAMATADYQAGSVPFLAVPASAALLAPKTRTVGASASLAVFTDTFATNTLANYTSTHDNGGSDGTWAWSAGLITGTLGNEPALVYNGVSAVDMYTEIVTDRLDGDGGLATRWVDSNNMFVAYFRDSASAASPNTFTLYSIIAGNYNLKASGSVSFTRGTSHTIRLSAYRNDITLFFDGVIIAVANDTSNTAAGKGAMIGASSPKVQHFQSFSVSDEIPFHSFAPPTDGYGIYDYTLTDMTAATYQPRLQQMAAGGFKLVMNYSLLSGSTADMIGYINYAASLGMKVIVNLKEPWIWLTPAIQANAPTLYTESGNQTTDSGFTNYVINQVKNLPGTWGYYVADEAQAGNHTALKAHADIVKAADAAKPRLAVEIWQVFGDAFYTYSSPEWDCCEVGGDDFYPYGAGAGQPTPEEISYGLQQYATYRGIQSAIVLQAFDNGAGPPTYSQMQTWLVAAGMYMQPRIILWYAYYEIFNAANSAQHWNDLVAVIAATAPVTRSIPATGALSLTKTRTVSSSVALLGTATRSVGTSGALLQTAVRTAGATAALLSTSSRTSPATLTVLLTQTRTVTLQAALLLTRTRTISTSAALGMTSVRQISSTVALLATSTRTIPTSGAVQSQASRSVPASSALSITRTVLTSGALSLTQARAIPASTALSLTQARQMGASVALLATITRTVLATGALQGQATRSIPATGALSITRIVPGSVALQATSTRTVSSSVALLSTRARTLTSSAALLASFSRSIGASAALLSTRTRTITTDAALSLIGTATRSIPATTALLATVSRSVGASAALGLSNVSRTVPVTTALLRQANRNIPASTPLQAMASRQVAASAALFTSSSRTVPVTTALLQQSNRVIPASTPLQAVGSRQVTTSVALVSQASRSIPVNAALIATLTRSSGATVALIATFSRTLGTSAALTIPGVKFRDVPCSASLSGGSRVIPATVALRGTQTRSIPCTASISLPVQGLQIGIPASAALSSTSTRFVLCTVALLASNATVRFRSGVADIRVRSGTVNIIVS